MVKIECHDTYFVLTPGRLSPLLSAGVRGSIDRWVEGILAKMSISIPMSFYIEIKLAVSFEDSHNNPLMDVIYNVNRYPWTSSQPWCHDEIVYNRVKMKPLSSCHLKVPELNQSTNLKFLWNHWYINHHDIQLYQRHHSHGLDDVCKSSYYQLKLFCN